MPLSFSRMMFGHLALRMDQICLPAFEFFGEGSGAPSSLVNPYSAKSLGINHTSSTLSLGAFSGAPVSFGMPTALA